MLRLTAQRLLYAFFIIKMFSFCPSPMDLPLNVLNPINTEFVDSYLAFKSEKNGKVALADFCLHQAKRLLDKETSSSMSSSDIDSVTTAAETLDISYNKLSQEFWVYAIKLCMNEQIYSEEFKNKFINLAQIKDEGSPFDPVVFDIFFATKSLMVRVKANATDYILKLPLSYLDSSPLPPRTSRNILLTRDTKTIERSIHANEKELNIVRSLEYIPYSKEMFIETCETLHNHLPKALVMYYGGGTLMDYILRSQLSLKNVTIIERFQLYLILISMLEQFNKDKISICDLKPDNILFDKNNIYATKLIDFESLTVNTSPCLVFTRYYAPPEINPAHYRYIATALNKKEFIYGKNMTFKKKLLASIINNSMTQITIGMQIKSWVCVNCRHNLNRLHLNVSNGLKLLKKFNSPSGYDNEETIKILTDIWTQIESKLPEYESLITKPSLSVPRNSLKFDVFSLGVIIFEIEVFNCYESFIKLKMELASGHPNYYRKFLRHEA